MKDELFAELLESVNEGGAILRKEKQPNRTFELSEPDVVAIRLKYRLSQAKFAALLGISVSTLRNWEQGRRRPEGAARVLLKVADRHPEAILDAVYKTGEPAQGNDDQRKPFLCSLCRWPCRSARPSPKEW